MYLKITTDQDKTMYVNSEKITCITAKMSKMLKDAVAGVVVLCDNQAAVTHCLNECLPVNEGMSGIEKLIVALQKSNETIIDVNAYVR